MTPDLSIIVVAYNSAGCILPCLAALASQNSPCREVFVVDNASSDETALLIAENHPAVTLMRNETNLGFAGANNQALRRCSGDYVLFLNPDTDVLPGALDAMVAYMKSHPRVGLAGARMLNPDGSSQWSVSYRYPGEKLTRGEVAGLPGAIAAVLGAAMIAPRSLLMKLGGFSEDFFLYGEDQDLCLRMRRAGHEIGFIEDAPVIHEGGLSERGSRDYDRWKRKIEAEYIFYRKHYRPSTVRRISRAYAVKARWRLATLRLALPFLNSPGKEKAREKLAKYRAIDDTVRSQERKENAN